MGKSLTTIQKKDFTMKFDDNTLTARLRLRGEMKNWKRLERVTHVNIQNCGLTKPVLLKALKEHGAELPKRINVHDLRELVADILTAELITAICEADEAAAAYKARYEAESKWAQDACRTCLSKQVESIVAKRTKFEQGVQEAMQLDVGQNGLGCRLNEYLKHHLVRYQTDTALLGYAIRLQKAVCHIVDQYVWEDCLVMFHELKRDWMRDHLNSEFRPGYSDELNRVEERAKHNAQKKICWFLQRFVERCEDGKDIEHVQIGGCF